MTFAVDQACKQSMIGSCFLSEHDSSKKIFRASTWISENENEARVQASERLVKCNDPAAKLSEPTFIPHAMACEQMKLTTDVAPSTPLPSLSRYTAERHNANDPPSVIPTLCLSIGSPGPHSININEKSLVNDLPYHPKPFTYPLAVQSTSPLSPDLSKSFNARQVNSQMQHSDLYDGKLPSLLRSNQCEYRNEAPHGQLSLGSYNKETAKQKNLCMSRFSFIEALTSENADDVQLVQQENGMRNAILPNVNDGRIQFTSSPSKNKNNAFDLEFEDSLGSFKRSSCLNSSTRTTNCISSQGSNFVLSGQNRESSSLTQAIEPLGMTMSLSQVLPTCISEPSPMKIKQDWDASKSNKYVQTVPDFFAQQKISLKLDTLSQHSVSDRGKPEKRCKLLFSGENVGVSSFGQCNAKPSTQIEYMLKHQDDQCSCGMESFDSQVKCNEKSLVDADVLSVKSEDKQRELMETNYVREGCSPVLATLMSSPPGSHVGNGGFSRNTLSREEVKSIELVNCPSLSRVNNLHGFSKEKEIDQTVAEWVESTPVSVVKGSVVVDGDWGKFLALSATPLAVGQSTIGTSADVVQPFQRRFKQLQTFLKQCDESDQTYCLDALRVLSAAERSGRAVALETRAVNLSIEEGKELKRMKMLNVLSKYTDTSITPQGPKLPAPGMTMLQVKQES